MTDGMHGPSRMLAFMCSFSHQPLAGKNVVVEILGFQKELRTVRHPEEL